ncbi:Apl3p Ecym_7451 [Eremothecium cymbalariae DBVPG|uniref:AP-2 complex subunit alpha n=1 Tax=Eremothecium cymbalariae (strain CBS 270.75 / DBVPG 7215 / KCTC 17166 / NRRL Y-17582) TaxID=931890 RepID=G8JWQ5_ERECY|nr:hypothetical protein Ecym_7451 [Eremothecium cymbalariae DBVPG\
MTPKSTYSNMRGLQLFIADLKSAQNLQEQQKRIQSELVNIKTQFGTTSLNGYQRKKYVAKLVYIYITTNTARINDLLFGVDQCLVLLKSNVYSEKFIGYMSLELFLYHEAVKDRVLYPVIDQLKLDLESKDVNFTSLALNFIGIVGPGSKQFCNELLYEVFKIIKAPEYSALPKSKASLAFLAIVREYPSFLTELDDERLSAWISDIFALLDDECNYGLILTALPLLEFLAQHVAYDRCVALIPKLVQILYRCVVIAKDHPNEFSDEYKYAGMPNPWLICNLVKVLNFLITAPNANARFTLENIDQQSLGKLRLCVSKAIDLNTPQNNFSSNIQHTIFFPLLNLVIKLDPSFEAITSSILVLCSFLTSKDINIQYLTLHTLVKLACSSTKSSQDTIRKNCLPKSFQLLKEERDVSIARKQLDLIYSLTDEENVEYIVDQLIAILSNSKKKPSYIRDDLCVKISLLLEKFAKDINWFVMSSLKLLSLTQLEGSLNDDRIWQRLCQIVVNNVPLHKLTCSNLLDYLYENNASEAIVRTGAFLLGEYADLVVEKVSIGDIFNILADKYFLCDGFTKGIILTTMIKLYRFNPAISSPIIKFYQLELNSLDLELQTRAYQYLKVIQLSKIKNDDMSLVDTLLSSMPSFTKNGNHLVTRLGNLSLDQDDLSVSTVGNCSSFLMTRTSTPGPTPPPSRNLKTSYSNINLTADWQSGFQRMLIHSQGVFYQNSLIRILYRITQNTSQPFESKIGFTCINRTELPITGFHPEVVPLRTDDNPAYIINITGIAQFTIQPDERTLFSFDIIIRHTFSVHEAPILCFNFRYGGYNKELNLKLGYGILATLQAGSGPSTLPQFIQRWRALSDALGKEGEWDQSTTFKSLKTLSSTLVKMGFAIVKQTTVTNTLFAMGIIHTKSGGNFGCLLKFKFAGNQLDIVCKTTTEGTLAKDVVECIISAV